MPTADCGPEVVERQVVIESFALSPDGARVVYVRRHVEGINYRSHLWSVAYRDGTALQLTSGALRDSSPTFSPDGTQLAFVRTPEGEDHGQLWLLALEDGSAQQLASPPHGVSSVLWSPDGNWLLLLAPSEDMPFIAGRQEGDRAPTARRITRLDWRDDDAGHRDRRTHLFLLEPRVDAQVRQLTSGDYDVFHPAWSPDGSRVTFAADRRPDSDLNPGTSLWTVAVSGNGPEELVALRGDADYPAYSPDGRWLAFLGRDLPEPTDYEPWHVWLTPTDGGGPARPLTAGRELSIGAGTWSDLALTDGPVGPVWLSPDSIACLIAARGRCHPYSLALGGEAPARLVGEDRLVATAVEARSGRVVLAAAIDGRAGELYALEGGHLRRLTQDGSAWQAGCPAPSIVELDIPGPAGPINTWLASPPDAGDQRLPLIFQFHGGPNGSYGAALNLDVLLLTAAGYRVALPNIRGSTGFGYDWAAQLDGHWGDVDVADTRAVVDDLVERGLVDRARIGAIGYSYAGYLIQWLAGTTDLLAAAVAENGVANQVSAWGNCFFGVYWDRRHQLGNPLSEEGMLRMWRSSPLAHVAQINIPLLLLQAEEDRVCPPADNEQLFTALRVLGRTTEYVLYPEEHHEMKNYGRPDRRIDRHRRTLDWFARHL